MGNIRDHLPECITTALFSDPAGSGRDCLPPEFSDSSVGHLILFDVWHHLEHPANALAEFRRVLVPRGRVILLEPAMSVVGRLVMGIATMSPWASMRLCPISWPIWMLPIQHATSPPSHRLTVFFCEASCPGCLRAGKFVPSVQSLPSPIWDPAGSVDPRSIPKPFTRS